MTTRVASVIAQDAGVTLENQPRAGRASPTTCTRQLAGAVLVLILVIVFIVIPDSAGDISWRRSGRGGGGSGLLSGLLWGMLFSNMGGGAEDLVAADSVVVDLAAEVWWVWRWEYGRRRCGRQSGSGVRRPRSSRILEFGRAKQPSL